jgi:hypothetical protein
MLQLNLGNPENLVGFDLPLSRKMSGSIINQKNEYE